MERIWVVEAKFLCGTWGVCSFGLGEFASDNYYTAHEIKRKQQNWLQEHGGKSWYKNRFRVREYRAV